MTTLGDIVATLRKAGQLAAEPVDPLPTITGLTADTRRLIPGMLYCAVRGVAEDGHQYLPAAAPLPWRPKSGTGSPPHGSI